MSASAGTTHRKIKECAIVCPGEDGMHANVGGSAGCAGSQDRIRHENGCCQCHECAIGEEDTRVL